MTIEPDALDVVRRFGDAWGRHDLEACLALVTDDCLFDATGPAPDGTASVGKEAIRQAWGPIFEDPSSSFTEEEIFGAADRVVQRWRYDWNGGHIRGVDVFLVVGGLVAEKRSYVKG